MTGIVANLTGALFPVVSESRVRPITHFETSAVQTTDLVGEEAVRAGRFCLAAGATAFRDGRMRVDQTFAVRPGEPHTSSRVRGW